MKSIKNKSVSANHKFYNDVCSLIKIRFPEKKLTDREIISMYKKIEKLFPHNFKDSA